VKEFPLNLSNFRKGLRPDGEDDRTRVACYQLDNARVGPSGLLDLKELQNPFGDDYLYDNSISLNNHPFPQLLQGKSKTLLCQENQINLVTKSTLGSWTVAPLTLYNAYIPTDEGFIIPNNAWQMVDFFDTWMLINGSSTVFQIKDPDNLYGFSNKVLVENKVPISAGCEHQGRAVLGGFSSDSFWSPAWLDFWDKWTNENVTATRTQMTLDTNWVMWTAVGAPDLLWLFYPTIARDGLVSGDPYSSTEPLIFDYLKRGDSGFMPMSWQGNVLKILPLGKGLVVYGDEGISHLQPVIDPLPGYGENVISRVGIKNVGAVAGNGSEHLCVDAEGHIWHMSAEGFRDLDYHEYLESMGDTIIVSHNEHDKDFYISDGDDCYLFHKGLSKTWQVVTSCFYDKVGRVGVYANADDF